MGGMIHTVFLCVFVIQRCYLVEIVTAGAYEANRIRIVLT